MHIFYNDSQLVPGNVYRLAISPDCIDDDNLEFIGVENGELKFCCERTGYIEEYDYVDPGIDNKKCWTRAYSFKYGRRWN